MNKIDIIRTTGSISRKQSKGDVDGLLSIVYRWSMVTDCGGPHVVVGC